MLPPLPESELDQYDYIILMDRTLDSNATPGVVTDIRIAMRRAGIRPDNQLWNWPYTKKQMPAYERIVENRWLLAFITGRLQSRPSCVLISLCPRAAKALKKSGIPVTLIVPPANLLS